MKEEEIVALVNARPEVVVIMSQKQLEGVMIHKPGYHLNPSTTFI
jgi:hypothetical protein